MRSIRSLRRSITFATLVLLVAVCGAALPLVAQSPQHRGLLVRLNADAVDGFNARHGTSASQVYPGQNLYLVTASDSRTQPQLLNEVSGDVATLAAEDDSDASDGCGQSTISVLNQSTISVLNQSTISVLNSGTVDYYGASVPKGYTNQPAIAQVDAAHARQLATGEGEIIALIDIGVDPNTPALKGVLLAGYNFYANNGDWSCYADLQAEDDSGDDQSTISVLNESQDLDTDDQSTISVLNDISMEDYTDSSDDQSTISVLNDVQSDDSGDDQSTISVLNDAAVTSADTTFYRLLKLFPDIGHGTAVAGLLHLLAPKAKIMPIKAFGPTGTADLAAIVASIYYAVDNGANVINMSFSATQDSSELHTAIQYAANHHVVLVAAAGNSGEVETVYPGSFPVVVSVAALNPDNTLASFSNFGPTVDLAAPGFDLVTTYPDNQWASVSGTSFSAPLVSAEAALVLQHDLGGNDLSQVTDIIMALTANHQIPAQQVGYGLIQVLRALAF